MSSRNRRPQIPTNAYRRAHSRPRPADARPPALQGTPTYKDHAPSKLVEVPPPQVLQDAMVRQEVGNTYLRCYRLGECTVMVTREWDRWHLSIAHRFRYPNWNEIAEARYRLLPDGIYVAMVLPPKSEYVNLHPNCFQVHEIDYPPAGVPGSPVVRIDGPGEGVS